MNSLAVSPKRVQMFKGKLIICRGKQKLATTFSSEISCADSGNLELCDPH